MKENAKRGEYEGQLGFIQDLAKWDGGGGGGLNVRKQQRSSIPA